MDDEPEDDQQEDTQVRSRRGLSALRTTTSKTDPRANMVKRMVIQNQQRVRSQRFRFDTIDYSLVQKFDIAMLAIQFVISIIYLGSWATFCVVRLPRVIWDLLLGKYRL